jgi:hypothetical protein
MSSLVTKSRHLVHCTEDDASSFLDRYPLTSLRAELTALFAVHSLAPLDDNEWISFAELLLVALQTEVPPKQAFPGQAFPGQTEVPPKQISGWGVNRGRSPPFQTKQVTDRTGG